MRAQTAPRRQSLLTHRSPFHPVCLSPLHPPGPRTPHLEKAVYVFRGPLRPAAQPPAPIQAPAEAGPPHPPRPPSVHAAHVVRSVQKEELSAEPPTLAASVLTNNRGLFQPHEHFRGFVSIKGTILLNQLMKHLLSCNSKISPESNVKCIQLHSPRFDKEGLISLIILNERTSCERIV